MLFVSWITTDTWTKREKWNAKKKENSKTTITEIDWLNFIEVFVSSLFAFFYSFAYSHSSIYLGYIEKSACFVHIAIWMRWFILFWIIMSVLCSSYEFEWLEKIVLLYCDWISRSIFYLWIYQIHQLTIDSNY